MQLLITLTASMHAMAALNDGVILTYKRSCKLLITWRPCTDRKPKRPRGFCTDIVPVQVLRIPIDCGSSFKELSLHCKHCCVCCSAEARPNISYCREGSTTAIECMCSPDAECWAPSNVWPMQEVQ